MRKHATNGQFLRTHKPWTPRRWDDGYLDNKGRFRVYRPDYPRAYALGYALRAHVVWWLAKGRVHRSNSELHHKNHNRTDDRLSNLEVLSRSQHRRQHVTTETVKMNCAHCDETFDALACKVRERGAKYCSQPCYHAHKRSRRHKAAISAGLARAYAEGRR